MVVLCYDRKSGNQLLCEVETLLVPHEGHHRDASFASISFCDGERIYCWFGSAGFEFRLQPRRGKNLGTLFGLQAKVSASLGEGSSPVVHDGKLVLVRDHSGQSTIGWALDAKTERRFGRSTGTKAMPGRLRPLPCTRDNTSHHHRLQKSPQLQPQTSGDHLGGGRTGLATAQFGSVVLGDVVYCMSGYKGFSSWPFPSRAKAMSRIPSSGEPTAARLMYRRQSSTMAASILPNPTRTS